MDFKALANQAREAADQRVLDPAALARERGVRAVAAARRAAAADPAREANPERQERRDEFNKRQFWVRFGVIASGCRRSF